MRSFSEYKIEENAEFHSVLDLIELEMIAMETSTLEEAWSRTNMLVEESEGRIGKWLSKIGISAHKTGPGLIDDLIKAGKGFYKFFMAIIKKDWKTVSEMANKEIKKEDVINFLLKLDQATLHLLTTPIHTLEAVTGWHIWANVHKVANAAKEIPAQVVSKVKDALQFIKKKVSVITDPKAKIISKAIDKIERKAPQNVLEA